MNDIAVEGDDYETQEIDSSAVPKPIKVFRIAYFSKIKYFDNW